MNITTNHHVQYTANKTNSSNKKAILFAGKPDNVSTSVKTRSIITNLLENTKASDWKKPLLILNKNVIAKRTLKHPEYGKITITILKCNLAIDMGSSCYSPDYNKAVITIPKKNSELSSTVLKTDVFKLALKATGVSEKDLIQPLDSNNPPKGV